MSKEPMNPRSDDLNRRKYVPSDVFHEIDRVKNLIDSGWFGELTYPQIGKLHKELYTIEDTFRTYIIDQT